MRTSKKLIIGLALLAVSVGCGKPTEDKVNDWVHRAHLELEKQAINSIERNKSAFTAADDDTFEEKYLNYVESVSYYLAYFPNGENYQYVSILAEFILEGRGQEFREKMWEVIKEGQIRSMETRERLRREFNEQN